MHVHSNELQISHEHDGNQRYDHAQRHVDPQQWKSDGLDGGKEGAHHDHHRIGGAQTDVLPQHAVYEETLEHDSDHKDDD